MGESCGVTTPRCSFWKGARALALIRTRRVCIVFLLFLALPVWTASGQEITLNVWINLWKDLQPIMEEAVAAYEAAHPGIKIDLQFERLSQGNEGYEKFIIATAAGVGPDLVMFSQWTELAE